MSLVGSEVAISGRFGDSSQPLVSDDEDMAATEVSSTAAAGEDQHPPVTPPGAAESLFFMDLNTQTVSAAALAQQIHQTHRASSWTAGTSTVATDDFATAVAWSSSDEHSFSSAPTPRALISNRSSSTFSNPLADDYESDNDSYQNIFEKDVLSRNHSIPEEEEDTFHESKMSTVSAKIPTMKTKTMKTPEKKFVTAEVPTHVDAAEKVYDTAKGVWAWGKGVAVFSPFLGIAEGVAGKAVSVTGNSLEGLDGSVIDTLHSLDDKILNPAVASILGTLLGAASSSEDFLKPIIVAILKPLGLIKDTAENPELTTVPGVTVTVQ